MLQDIGNRYQGKNILVVAHGEVQRECFMQTPHGAFTPHIKLPADVSYGTVGVQAVNRSVTRLMPWATVIDAQHCCYTVAHRKQDDEGDWGPWELNVQKLHKVEVVGL